MLLSLAVFFSGCDSEPEPGLEHASGTAVKNAGITIKFEKYVLDNGLDVVLHVDHSDPIVAINIAAHVGSGREIVGRTGFAHLFEHLLFLDSENLGYGGLDKMNTRIGGEGTNGFTTTDMTQYFQAVPADALEKVIWAEADKLGYFINTVSQPVIDNEKQVVKNEKRQRVDNQPYGHTDYVIGKALYPEGHPYNWQIIGSLADLDAATLEDVKNFYRQWYVPNNVTLTITGDFDVAQAKQLVEKYFGEIPRGADPAPQTPRASTLHKSRSLYHEDSFATAPQLTIVWPAVSQLHEDSYALDMLAEYLAKGKRAPLNEVLIDEQQLTSDLSAFFYGKEVAGEFYLNVNANANGDLDDLLPAIEAAFARFEEKGISQDDLDRIKAGLEVKFYGRVQSVLGKSIELGQNNTLADDPNRINTEILKIQAVTVDDLMRVYKKYIQEKPHLATSFVPLGQLDLALKDAGKAEVVEEVIVQNAEAEVDFDPAARTFESTQSKFDRTIEPEFGAPYTLPVPPVWRDDLGNGIRVYGTQNDETPLVQFSLSIDAGRNRNSAEKPAVANLTADMLGKGTIHKSTAELEDAIKSLGSEVNIVAQASTTVVSGKSLARNFQQTIALVEEMLLEPRWDPQEFDLMIRRQSNQINLDGGNPRAISFRELAKLAYPEDHVYSYQPYGTKAKLAQVTLNDLEKFHESYYTPVGAKLRVVGDVDPVAVAAAFAGLAERWTKPIAEPVSTPQAREVTKATLYFYDIPDAKQSVLRMQRPSLTAVDEDYPLAKAMNFLLGNIYTSRLNTELRVNKGYTYGIRSAFRGSLDRGSFDIGSSVRSNVTLESIDLIHEIVSDFGPGFSQTDLDVLKGALLRGQALQNETLSAKLSMLSNISIYGYPDDYQANNAQRISAMNLDKFKSLAGAYLRPDEMNYLIVGDAKTQLERLEELGMGKPVLLDNVSN